jgi:HEAT repeat protein
MRQISDKAWNELLSDLQLITGDETDEEFDRAIKASEKIGQLRDKKRLPDLYRLLNKDDLFVRESVGMAIANISGLDALPRILAPLEDPDDGHDYDGLVTVITDLVGDNPQAVKIVRKMMTSKKAVRRSSGVWLAGYLAKFIHPEEVYTLLQDPDPQVRSSALGALSSFAYRQQKMLENAAKDKSNKVRRYAKQLIQDLKKSPSRQR